MIVECSVWCVLDPENESMGLKTHDVWMKFAIDFNSIIAIKQAGENEFLGHNKATVYFPNEIVTLDMSYDTALKIWRSSKT